MSDEGSVYLSLLAEDKHVIAYRPKFAALTDSAMSAILLQQMIHRWKKQQGEAFYKFKQACQHERYREGDSWCEELEWNAYEFDQALKVIGTKVTKGVKKQELLDTEPPTRNEGESDEDFLKRLETAVSRIVLYWTDSNRVTWYLLNEKLLGKFVGRIYLDKFYGLRYLKKSIASVTQKNRWLKRTLSSESPSDSSKEIDTNVSIAPPPQEPKRTTSEQNKVVGTIEPEKAADAKEKPATLISARAAAHEATEKALRMGGMSYSIIEKYANFLTGQMPEKDKYGKRNGEWFDNQINPGMSVPEIQAFGYYLRTLHSDLEPLRKSSTINDYAARFRRDKEHDRMVARYQPKPEQPAAPPAQPAQPAPEPAPDDDEPFNMTREEMAAEMERLEAALVAKLSANDNPRGGRNVAKTA